MPFAGVLLGLALITLLATSLAALSYALGMATRGEESLAPVLNSMTVPLLPLSGILLTMSLAPGQPDIVSRFTPLVMLWMAFGQHSMGNTAIPDVVDIAPGSMAQVKTGVGHEQGAVGGLCLGTAGYLFTGTSVPFVVKPLLVAQRCVDEIGWSGGCQLVARWFSADSSLSTGAA